MPSSTSATSVSHIVQSQLLVCSQCSEKVERKCSSCNMKEIAHIALEDSGNSSATEGICVVAVQDQLGYEESVNIQACSTQSSAPCLSPEEDVTIISREITMCQEFSQSLTLDGKALKCLSKSKTFPLSKENPAGTSVPSQDSAANSGFARSISLPPSSTCISAMKGGRAQSGAVVTRELRVKWAPGVYDPPTTTMSHTVRGHQQRPKAKKKDKSKHKGKSSRGGGERNHGNRKCSNKMPEPLNARLQASGNKQALDSFENRKVVNVLEYNMNCQDAKCSGSFLWETHSKVQLPVGEAS